MQQYVIKQLKSVKWWVFTIHDINSCEPWAKWLFSIERWWTVLAIILMELLCKIRQNNTFLALTAKLLVEQSTPVLIAQKAQQLWFQYCNEGKINVVSVCPGLNEATCYEVPVCMLDCKVQTSQCWDGKKKKKKKIRYQVCISQDLRRQDTN